MENWYAVKTKTGFGEQDKAENNLLSQMIDTFNPKVVIEKLKKGKVITELEPVFRNYVFVKFDPAITSAAKINNSFGVSKLVTFGNKLIKVDERLIDQLKERHQTREPINSIRPNKGDTVTINKGPFAGVEAIYQEPDGETRSMLLMGLLGGQQKIIANNADFL